MQFNGPDGQEDMPYLLTPGPVTTSRGVKVAMLADWGSRDGEFTSLVKKIRRELLRLAGCNDNYDCVIMQGSGTFAMEAALGSLAPRKRKKTLVLANGAYGERAAKILEKLDRPFERISLSDTTPLQPSHFTHVLDADSSLTHVWLVHCETTSGIVNPLGDLAREVKSRGRLLMVDAMSSFGALDINMPRDGIDVLISSANKCIEGVPGFSFVILKKDLLVACEGNSHSIVMDLFEQWRTMEETGQFRFTPPTHALVAFQQALMELEEEGGPSARLKRYKHNADTLISGLTKLGLVPLLTATEVSPVVQTFMTPRDANFVFSDFAARVHKRGFVIYPGKLTLSSSFRIGTIGQLTGDVMDRVVTAVREVLNEMNVRDMMPRDL